MTSRFDTPASLLASPRMSGVRTHPSGTVVALRKELSADGKKYVTHAWSVVTGSDGVHGVQLTHDQHGVSEVCPAAQGAVFFTSTRPVPGDDKDRTRLWLLPPRGEARMLVDLPDGVENVHLGGDRLFFVSGTFRAASGAQDVLAENERLATRREELAVSAVLYDTAPTRDWDHDLGPEEPTLWSVSASDALAGRDVRDSMVQVKLPEGVLSDYQVPPDGNMVVATLKVWIDGGWERSEVWRVPAVGNAAAAPDKLRGAAQEDYWAAGPVSPDGTRMILLREGLWRATANLTKSLWTYEFATGALTEVLPTDDHWGEHPQWLDENTFVCTADHRGRGIVLRVSCTPGRQPRADALAGGDGQSWTYSSVEPAGDTLWGLRTRVDRPEELVHWPITGSAEPQLVPGLVPEDVPAGHMVEVTAVGEDGTAVRAWLALPGPSSEPDDAPARELPLLVFVHGGPWNSNNAWSWRWNPWPFVAQGYAVLLPDPAISTGYGQAMIDRGQQELGGSPFTDVMALVEATTQRADIDAQRQALLGGSYGGYMANWVAGHTGTRFRCIVTHASLWDVHTMGSTTDNTEWEEAMAPSQAQEYSPHRFVSEIQVPVLVIHGGKDYRVPISQGLQLWSDLQRHTSVEGHKFLYFPDENHWILKPGNARVWYQTVLAFVDQHVLDGPWERPELLG